MIGRRVREKRSSHSEGKGRPGRARTREPGFLGVKSIGTPPHRHRHRQAGRRHQPARGSPLGSPPGSVSLLRVSLLRFAFAGPPLPAARSACPCLCVHPGWVAPKQEVTRPRQLLVAGIGHAAPRREDWTRSARLDRLGWIGVDQIVLGAGIRAAGQGGTCCTRSFPPGGAGSVAYDRLPGCPAPARHAPPTRPARPFASCVRHSVIRLHRVRAPGGVNHSPPSAWLAIG